MTGVDELAQAAYQNRLPVREHLLVGQRCDYVQAHSQAVQRLPYETHPDSVHVPKGCQHVHFHQVLEGEEVP